MSKVKPLLVPIAILVVGIVIGTIVGWSTASVIETGPWQLHPTYRAYYVLTVADAYGANGNTQAALTRIGFLCGPEGVTAAINTASSLTNDPEQLANLDALSTLAPQWQGSALDVCNTQPSGTLGTIRGLLLIVALVAVVGFIGYAGYSIFTESRGAGAAGLAVPSALGGSRASSKRAPKLEKAKSPAAKGAAIAAVTEKTDYAQAGNPPIVQFMTTYLEGDDLFDDSFSIETSAGEFLGETGVGISESLGVGEPKRVTAMEIWLFDKNDIRTVTKVLMSDHAFNDEGLKAKLAPKGEAALAESGGAVNLETATLRIQAKVIDIEYAAAPYRLTAFSSASRLSWPRGSAMLSSRRPRSVTSITTLSVTTIKPAWSSSVVSPASL